VDLSNIFHDFPMSCPMISIDVGTVVPRRLPPLQGMLQDLTPVLLPQNLLTIPRPPLTYKQRCLLGTYWPVWFKKNTYIILDVFTCHTHIYIYNIIAYHIILYHIKIISKSYQNHISCQISSMKYHIISNNIISYHIISCHIYYTIFILYYIKNNYGISILYM